MFNSVTEIIASLPNLMTHQATHSAFRLFLFLAKMLKIIDPRVTVTAGVIIIFA